MYNSLSRSLSRAVLAEGGAGPVSDKFDEEIDRDELVFWPSNLSAIGFTLDFAKHCQFVLCLPMQKKRFGFCRRAQSTISDSGAGTQCSPK